MSVAIHREKGDKRVETRGVLSAGCVVMCLTVKCRIYVTADREQTQSLSLSDYDKQASIIVLLMLQLQRNNRSRRRINLARISSSLINLPAFPNLPKAPLIVPDQGWE